MNGAFAAAVRVFSDDRAARDAMLAPAGHDAVPDVVRALAYRPELFGEAFSPYQFRQARILEFPAYATFAQSFANTIPYSEDIGFLARLGGPARL